MGRVPTDMQSDPLVSIVLPTYNRCQHLAAAIENCLAQSYTNWELIIVNDGSTDDSASILANFAAQHPRIQVVTHPVNRKLPASLNTGFAHAKGDLFTWTSDDNYYHPDAIREMVNVLVAHPECSLVYADYSDIDENGQVLRTVSVADYIPTLLYKNAIGPCFLYKCEVQFAIGNYAEDLFLAEDYDYWLRASQKFKLIPLHKDLYRYRRHSSSLTDSYSVTRRWNARELAILRSIDKVPWATHTARAQAYLHLSSLSYDRKDIRSTAEYLWRGLTNDPVFMARRLIVVSLRQVLGSKAVDKLREAYVGVMRRSR